MAAIPSKADHSSGAFELLDTNGDGDLTVQDDPYAPYYPGDDAVDWVGMSLYHWGAAFPWGENELPEADKFAAQLTGAYVGTGGDDSGLPDFYGEYAVEHGKPLAITETAAFFAVGVDGDDEFQIKQLWWRQVLAPELAETFPQLKMINWFEWHKFETEVDGEVDWTVTNDPELRAAFQSDLPPTFDSPKRRHAKNHPASTARGRGRPLRSPRPPVSRASLSAPAR